MEARGIPGKSGIIATLLTEHKQGRGYVRQMDQAIKSMATGNNAAFKAATGSSKEYATLLRKHIKKETNIAFPMADRVFTKSDNEELSKKFEEIEHDRIGPGKHEEYLKFIDKLEAGMKIK